MIGLRFNRSIDLVHFSPPRAALVGRAGTLASLNRVLRFGMQLHVHIKIVHIYVKRQLMLDSNCSFLSQSSLLPRTYVV